MAGRRDFRAELAGDKCWDRGTQALFERHGEPLEDCILQNREELIGLCEFIVAQGVRSYLEVGVWTGRLIHTSRWGAACRPWALAFGPTDDDAAC